MTDEIESITEGAKAIQETAKTGRAVIEAGSDAARFVSKVLGTVPQDVVGLTFGDYIGELRIRNLDRLQRNTEKKLRDRSIEEPIHVSPNLAIPLFEAASEESDETLQQMWANLLANAMDPSRTDISLQRVFITTLKQFEPVDTVVLKHLASYRQRNNKRAETGTIFQELGLRHSLILLSLKRLRALECVKENNGAWRLDSLGEELYLTCEPDPADQS